MTEWRKSKLAHKKFDIVTSFPVFSGNVDCVFELCQLFIRCAIESRLIGMCNEIKANRARIGPNWVDIGTEYCSGPKRCQTSGHFAPLIRVRWARRPLRAPRIASSVNVDVWGLCVN
jgi:hypothetical protein